MDIAGRVEHIVHYDEVDLLWPDFMSSHEQDLMEAVDAAYQGIGVRDDVSVVMREQRME